MWISGCFGGVLEIEVLILVWGWWNCHKFVFKFLSWISLKSGFWDSIFSSQTIQKQHWILYLFYSIIFGLFFCKFRLKFSLLNVERCRSFFDNFDLLLCLEWLYFDITFNLSCDSGWIHQSSLTVVNIYLLSNLRILEQVVWGLRRNFQIGRFDCWALLRLMFRAFTYSRLWGRRSIFCHLTLHDFSCRRTLQKQFQIFFAQFYSFVHKSTTLLKLFGRPILIVICDALIIFFASQFESRRKAFHCFVESPCVNICSASILRRFKFEIIIWIPMEHLRLIGHSFHKRVVSMAWTVMLLNHAGESRRLL